MKYMILRFVISAALKLAFAYALRLVSASIVKVETTLAAGGISDESRASLTIALKGLEAVADLLRKFSEIIGTPEIPLEAQIDQITDAAEKLKRITDGL